MSEDSQFIKDAKIAKAEMDAGLGTPYARQAMSERDKFEAWYMNMMPCAALSAMRDGDSYKDTDGDRLAIAWDAWRAASRWRDAVGAI